MHEDLSWHPEIVKRGGTATVSHLSLMHAKKIRLELAKRRQNGCSDLILVFLLDLSKSLSRELLYVHVDDPSVYLTEVNAVFV